MNYGMGRQGALDRAFKGHGNAFGRMGTKPDVRPGLPPQAAQPAQDNFAAKQAPPPTPAPLPEAKPLPDAPPRALGQMETMNQRMAGLSASPSNIPMDRGVPLEKAMSPTPDAMGAPREFSRALPTPAPQAATQARSRLAELAQRLGSRLA